MKKLLIALPLVALALPTVATADIITCNPCVITSGVLHIANVEYTELRLAGPGLPLVEMGYPSSVIGDWLQWLPGEPLNAVFQLEMSVAGQPAGVWKFYDVAMTFSGAPPVPTGETWGYVSDILLDVYAGSFQMSGRMAGEGFDVPLLGAGTVSIGWHSPATSPWEGFDRAANVVFSFEGQQPIPEPGTLLLLAGGLSALMVRRLKHRP